MSMRQASSSKRSRSKGGNRSGGGRSPLNRSYESNGPGGKIRGNPHQLYEKYLSMARDALSADDRVLSENLTQHADHYFRVVLEANNSKGQQEDTRRQESQNLDGQSAKGGEKEDGESPQAKGNGEDRSAEAEGEAQPRAEGDGAESTESDAESSGKASRTKRRGRPPKSNKSTSEDGGEEDSTGQFDAA